MSKVLFVPSVPQTEWIVESMPWISPAELPMAGMRVVDYMFERVQKLDARFMEILDWHFSPRLAADFSEKTRTGYPVFYVKGGGNMPCPRGLNDLNSVSSPLTKPVQDGLWVVWGACLSCDNGDFLAHELEPVSSEECADTPQGVYRFLGGRWMRTVGGCNIIDGPKAWHERNMAVLHNHGTLTLPGYSSEKDVHLGRNVVLEHGTEVKPPVLLQDNVWCARNVQLNGDVIVGKGTFIGEGAKLLRTVVGDDTYVGAGLDLVDKIVIGRRIFDAVTGAWTVLDDSGVAGHIQGFVPKWISGIWKFLYGASRGRRR